MMLYRLKTPIAEFELRREPLGMWDIWVNGAATMTYATAEEACRAVAARESGYVLWDNAEETAPGDLSGWERIDE